MLCCYKLYRDYTALFRTIGITDTAIHHYAMDQLAIIDKLDYDMETQHSLFTGHTDQAYSSFLTGLLTDQYPKTRVKRIARKILDSLEIRGETDKSLALLNSLAVNTTADDFNRDSLLTWYVRLNKVNGVKMYANVMSKLSGSAFKKTDQQVKLPEQWNFVLNTVPMEKLQKAKYMLVDFWDTSCGPCLNEIPALNALQDRIKGRDDVLLISVNADFVVTKMNDQFVLKRSRELNIKFPIFYDNAVNNLGKQLAVDAYPSKFVLNAKGEVLMKTDNSETNLETFDLFVKELNNSK